MCTENLKLSHDIDTQTLNQKVRSLILTVSVLSLKWKSEMEK